MSKVTILQVGSAWMSYTFSSPASCTHVADWKRLLCTKECWYKSSTEKVSDINCGSGYPSRVKQRKIQEKKCPMKEAKASLANWELLVRLWKGQKSFLETVTYKSHRKGKRKL